MVIDIKIVEAAAQQLARGQVHNRPVLSSWSSVLDYCRTAMVSEDNIVFAHLAANASNSDESFKPQIPKVFAIERVILLTPHFSGQIVFTPIFRAR